MIAADQLKFIVQRVERIEAEISDLNADKSEIYKEARANGFDVKAIKKVVSQRKIDDHKREEQDLVFETYWDAVHGTNLVHAHARENIEEFDPITGEFTESPRKAAEAVSERTAIADATEAPVLVEADKAEAVAGGLGQLEVIPALTVQHDGVNVGGPERAGVTAGETATNPEMDREEMRGGRAVHSLPAENARKAGPETEDGSVTHAGAGESPATDQPLTGGDHVVREPSAATQRAGALVEAAPATPGDVTYEDFPPVPMKRTSFAHCFPELSAREYDALGTSIAFEGVLEPIVRRGNIILDGWSRYNIARNLGIQYPVVEYDGEDELLDVIRWQRAARKFTPAQSKKIAVELAKEVPHRASDIMAAFELEMEEA